MSEKKSDSHELNEESENVETFETEKDLAVGVSADSPEPGIGDEDSPAESLPDSGNQKKKGSMGFGTFLKIFSLLILLGGVGLGGFWCYTKIKIGMDISDTITDLNSRMSSIESNQEKMNENLRGIQFSVNKILKSNTTMVQIPQRLEDIEEKLGSISQAISGIPQQKGFNMEVPVKSPMIQAPQAEGASPTLEKENALETFMRSLFIQIGRGFTWLFELMQHGFGKVVDLFQ